MTATSKESASDREILLVGPYGVLGTGVIDAVAGNPAWRVTTAATHFMSQTRITIPITVSELHSETADTEPVSDQYFPEERGDEQYRFIVPEYRGTYGPFDPWSLRSEFLGWKLREWRSFFGMAGAFGTALITRDDFEEWQRLMRKALLVPSREWKNLSGEFDPEKVSRLRV